MNLKKSLKNFLFLIIVLLVLMPAVLSSSSSSESFNNNVVISDGGQKTSSDNFISDSIIGEISGVIESINFRTAVGFFYDYNQLLKISDVWTDPSFPNNLENVSILINISDYDIDQNISCQINSSFYNNKIIYESNGETIIFTFVIGLLENDTYNYNITCNDGYDIVNLNNNELIVTVAIPETVILISPSNNNNTIHSRTPTFLWNNSKYSEWYDINITSNNCPNIFDNTTYTNYTPISNLCLYSEGFNTYYDWMVRGCNSNTCGNWSEIRNFSIEPYLDILFAVNNLSFGSLSLNEEKNTSSGDPSPIIMRNTGNVLGSLNNISVNDSLWESVDLGTEYWQLKANISENISFNISGSQMNWFNISNSINTTIIDGLNYINGNNSAALDMLVKSPPSEPVGAKSGKIWLVWVQS